MIRQPGKTTKAGLAGIWPALVAFLASLFMTLHLYGCIHLILGELDFMPSSEALAAASMGLALAALAVAALWYRKGPGRLGAALAGRARRLLDALGSTRARRFLALFALPLAIRGLLIFLFRTPIDNDPAVYTRNALDIVRTGLVQENAAYSLAFPHQFWYGLFLLPAALFGGADWHFQMYIALILSAGACLLYGIVEPINGRRRAMAASLVFSYLPSQLFGALAVTHEHGFTFLLLCGLWIWVRGRRRQSPVLPWTGVCLVLAALRLVNAIGLVAIVAAACCLLFVRWDARLAKLRTRAACALILAAVIAAASWGSAALQARLIAGHQQPVHGSSWYTLYVGANVRKEGRFNRRDLMVYRWFIHGDGPEDDLEHMSERGEKIREAAVARWKALAANPVRLAKHFARKFCNVWTGTHYALELVDTEVDEPWVHRLMLAVMALNNALYALMIALSLPPLWRRMKRPAARDTVFVYLDTLVIGTAATLLLTEVMNKYSLTMFAPIVLLTTQSIFRRERPRDAARR